MGDPKKIWEKETQFHFSRSMVLAGIMGILGLFYILFNGQFITGGITYNQGLAEAQTNLTVCYDFNRLLLASLEQAAENNSYYKAKAELAKEEKNKNQVQCHGEVMKVHDELSEKLSECETEAQQQVYALKAENDVIIAQLKNDLDAMAKDYETIISNAARTICCKARVDDPGISSYDIQQGKIVCTSGGEKIVRC